MGQGWDGGWVGDGVGLGQNPFPRPTGAFNKIYKARHRESGEVVALKSMQLETVGSSDGVPLEMIREMSILMSIRHPNIVQVKEAVVDAGSMNPSWSTPRSCGSCSTLASWPSGAVSRLLAAPRARDESLSRPGLGEWEAEARPRGDAGKRDEGADSTAWITQVHGDTRHGGMRAGAWYVCVPRRYMVMELVDFDLGLLIEHMKQPFSEGQVTSPPSP